MRVQEDGSEWLVTWAFRIDEAQASRAGYGSGTRIDKPLTVDSSFRGCPYCEADGFVQCGGCRRISCWFQGSDEWRCGWPGCGVTGAPTGTIENFDGGYGD